MKKIFVPAVVVVALLAAAPARAAVVTFDFIESVSDTFKLTGSFTIDDSLFNGGTFQFLPNSDILSLSATANTSGGPIFFGTADIVKIASTIFNSAVSPVTVPDGAGSLATNGSIALVIFSGQTDLDGATSATYNGTWTEVSTTPLPAALPLFATGLGVMGLFGRRMKRKNAAAVVAA